MGELSIHRWKGFELYPVINKKTVSPHSLGNPINWKLKTAFFSDNPSLKDAPDAIAKYG
jgi:hypothetical protein